MSAYDPNYYYQYYYTTGYLPQQQILQLPSNHTINSNNHHGHSCCHKPTCPNRCSCPTCNPNNCISSPKISIKSEVCKSVKQALTETILSTIASKTEIPKSSNNKSSKKTDVYQTDYKNTTKNSNESLNRTKYQSVPYEYEYYYNSKGQKVMRYVVRDETYLSGSNQSLKKEDISANYQSKPRTIAEDSRSRSNESLKREKDYLAVKDGLDYSNKPKRIVEYVYEDDYYNTINSTRKSSSSSLNGVPTTSSAFKSYSHSSSASDLENLSRKLPYNQPSTSSNSSLKSILKNSTKKVEFNDYPSIRTIKPEHQPDRSISHEDTKPILRKNSNDAERYRTELVIEPTRTKPSELIIDTSKLNESKTSSRSSSLSRKSRSIDDLFDYDGVPPAPTKFLDIPSRSDATRRAYTPNVLYSNGRNNPKSSSVRENSQVNSKNYPHLSTSYQMHSENKNSLYPDLSFASKPLYRTLNNGNQSSEASFQDNQTQEDNHKLINGIRNVILSSPNKEEVHKNLNKGIRYVAKKILKN
jgi:hypothetical protein